MKNILLYIWQLPQNLLGLILYLFYYEDVKEEREDKNYTLFLMDITLGVTLGKYIFLWYKDKDLEGSLKHELGHTRQSKLLGPLYLFVIGIPSALWNIFHGKNEYYDFYTEKWLMK